MQNLADTVRPFINKIRDQNRRKDAERALEFLIDVNIDLIPAEQANKGLPRMRKALASGRISVIANRGKINSLDEAHVMMSMAQLVEIVGNVFDGAEKNIAKRRPADAILAQLQPTHPSVLDMRIGLRDHEEIVGGRRQLF